MPYIGKSPNFGVRNRFVYVADASDTSVSGADANGATLTFSDGAFVDVYLNGVLLKPTTDYNTSTANTIAGISSMSANDEVTVVVYDVFAVSDTVSAASGGTFSGGVTVGSTLDVTGNVSLDGGNFVFNESSADKDFRVESNGNANMLFVDGGNNRVGIGIGDPDQILELNDQTSGADVAIHFAGNGVDHTIGIDASNSGYLTIANSATVGTNPYFTFGASTRIFAGAASIHSAIAGGGLSIKPTSNTHQLMLEQENGSNGAEGWLFHASSGGGPLIFTRRTSSSDTARFQIADNGDLTATDTDGIGSISDERLKKDIVDFTYSIDDFKKYKPRKFNWKNPELHSNQTNTIGFIAQELEAVDNRFVYETTYYDVKDTDEYKALEKKVTDKTATEDEKTTYNEMKLQSEQNKNNLDKQHLDADGVAKASKFLRKDAMYVSVIQQLIARIEALESK